MLSRHNNSIEMMRLLASIMVVAIHTNPFYDINEGVGFFITMVLPRVAVPFFFLISGYYFIHSHKSLYDILISYSLQYLIISLIYFSCHFLITADNYSFLAIFHYIYHRRVSFFFSGSWYHLW